MAVTSNERGATPSDPQWFVFLVGDGRGHQCCTPKGCSDTTTSWPGRQAMATSMSPGSRFLSCSPTQPQTPW